MELSDTGTDHNRLCGDETWAHAAGHAFSCFRHPMCVAPKPAWLSDAQQLKRMADRAAAACPDDNDALQMRSIVYTHCGVPSADDLRQALRDRRRLLEMYEEGSAAQLGHARAAQAVEARLRARIAADVAAMKSR